jgi:serine/threonine-protein kinase
MLAVCAGVFAAHESGVVHRDLKPQNIFLARTPLGELVPKVLDFGISKLLDDELSDRSPHRRGDGHHPLPLARAGVGQARRRRSDQYALG